MFKLYNDDCLKVIDELVEKGIKVDTIITDPPYGTTDCKWDKVSENWFEKHLQVLNNKGIFIIFSCGSFTFKVIRNSILSPKYKYVWIKNNSTNFVHAKNRPMTKHEDILVFSKSPMGHISQLKDKRMTYNPQGLIEVNKTIKAGKGRFGTVVGEKPSHKKEFNRKYTNYPTDVLFDFPEPPAGKKLHTSEKPIKLLEFLVKTYTNENATVFDGFMGSGTTGVACVNTNRKFIGVEKEEKYYKIAKERIENAKLSF